MSILLAEINQYLKSWFNETYSLIERHSDKVFVSVVEEHVTDPVLKEYVSNGMLVLNLSSQAYPTLTLVDDGISAHMRFNKRPVEVYIPYVGIVLMGDGYNNIAITPPNLFLVGVPDEQPLPETDTTPPITEGNVVSVAFGKKKP